MTLWIRTVMAADGCYVPTIGLGADVVVPLDDPTKAMAYASQLLAACAEAEYEATCLALIEHVGSTQGVELVQNLRRRSAMPAQDRGAPITFEPLLSQRTKRGIVQLILHGRPHGQLELDAARAHAVAVIEAVYVARLDNTFHDLLVGDYEVNSLTAERVVAGLADHRPTP